MRSRATLTGTPAGSIRMVTAAKPRSTKKWTIWFLVASSCSRRSSGTRYTQSWSDMAFCPGSSAWSAGRWISSSFPSTNIWVASRTAARFKRFPSRQPGVARAPTCCNTENSRSQRVSSWGRATLRRRSLSSASAVSAPGVTAVTRLISSMVRLAMRLTSARRLAGATAPLVDAPNSWRNCLMLIEVPN